MPYIPEDGIDEPDGPVYASMTDALDDFALYRNKEIELLGRADDIMWQKRATHPEYERRFPYILARYTLMHDFRHMYLIEELWLTRDAYLTKLE